MTGNNNPCHPAKPSVPTSHDIGWNTGYAIEAYPPNGKPTLHSPADTLPGSSTASRTMPTPPDEDS